MLLTTAIWLLILWCYVWYVIIKSTETPIPERQKQYNNKPKVHVSRICDWDHPVARDTEIK